MLNTKTIISKNAKEFILSPSDLSRLKKIQTMMLEDLYASCRKRNILICLFYGTLLGSVRHDGYIPWDDDIDTVAYYSDFQNIMNAVKEDFEDKYYFVGICNRDIDDPFYSLKLVLRGTSQVELSCTNLPNERGISIDIFPIIHTSTNRLIRKIHEIRIRYLLHASVLGFECKYPITIKYSKNKKIKLLFKIRRFVGFFYKHNYRKLRLKLEKNYCKFGKSDAYIFDAMLGYSSKYFFKKEFLNSLALYDFEGIKFESFKNYDLLLKMMYGDDYMVLPPEEKREMHLLSKIDFGDYE